MIGQTAKVSEQWAARPLLGACLRLLALLGPVVVGLVTAVVVAHVLPPWSAGGARLLWWVTVLGVSGAAVFAADRAARRLLPLAVLLELSLIFPDRAPSRLRAARTSSVRELDARIARLRGEGVPMEPYEAAETVVTLVGILGLHDKRTRGHSERVRGFTDLLSEELGLDEQARVRLRWAALVHDLGKLTVPTSVLNSPRILDDAAWDLMRRHPDEGVRLLGGLLPFLGEWGDAVGQHHERYDGTGYPLGLAGEQISLAGRIVALADSFEVMTSARSYKQPRSAAWARTELTRCAGQQFDPALVRAFLGISLGRLRWVLGPVTWLAELPFVATADRAGQTVKVASVTVLAAGLVTGAVWPGPGALTPRPGTAQAAEAPQAQGQAGGRPAQRSEGRGAGATTASTVPSPVETAATPSAAPSLPETGQGEHTAQAQPGRSGAPTRPAPAPRPSAAPGTPLAAEPAASLPNAYHLTSRGLREQPSGTQEVVRVSTGQTVRFDHQVDRDAVLPATRDLVLFAAFATRQGSAKITARLLDCPRASAAGCAELGTSQVPQLKSEGFEQYVLPLSRAGGPDRIPAGHVLRLEVELREPGAKGPARLALGSEATPSRLRLGTSGP